jgi:plastocyanin
MEASENSGGEKIIPIVLLTFLISLIAYGKMSKIKVGLNSEKVQVMMQGHRFTPDPVIIPVNSTVTWTNKDDIYHIITSDQGLFDSDTIKMGNTWSHQFTTAGTFKYHCRDYMEMTGTITVR